MKKFSISPWIAAAATIIFSTNSHALWPDTTGVGVCNFSNPYAGTSDCIVYSGDNWDATTAANDCATLFSASYTYSFSLGGTCNLPNEAAVCVEDSATADEKININSEDLNKDESQCNTLSGVCAAIIKGDYYPTPGGICDTEPEPTPCEELGLETEACVALEDTSEVDVTEDTDYISFMPLGNRGDSNFIFIPGASILPEAYAPLAQELAKNGIHTTILVNQDPAPIQAIMNLPENGAVQNWLIGGHSLGGVAASKYILDNPGTISGLALLASFPDVVDDLSSEAIQVVSVYAENDLLATPAEVTGAAAQLPAGKTIFAEVRGGNHANFGHYGDQGGDGVADIPKYKQLELTSASIRHLAARVAANSTNTLHPYAFLMDKMTNITGCKWTQHNAASYTMGQILNDTAVEYTDSLSSFVSSQPTLTPGGSTQFQVKSYIGQSGNATDLDLPPIVDGSIQCKGITQDRVIDELQIQPFKEQGQCKDMHMFTAYYATFLLGDDANFLSWTFNFTDDLQFSTGPDFIIDPTAVPTVDIDDATRTVTITAPAFFAENNPELYGAAAGRQYCKTLSFEKMFMLLRYLSNN
ncbi:alpha/beta hydrolase [Oceanicoccus sp. KOV_DT_Chl]|uniref:alpha/beta hydrolase n=1 Tax=Oceanicoccus sp. KOV_DT_Chl TaxID=1904639 RepID=UPI000C7AD448|nr:alpha/beta hydrolase [Oceanicoccus sp. KOV_DT_Chl]